MHLLAAGSLCSKPSGLKMSHSKLSGQAGEVQDHSAPIGRLTDSTTAASDRNNKNGEEKEDDLLYNSMQEYS